MVDSSIAAILVAVVGGGFGVWSAFISSKNQKATKGITNVLENTKAPVDSLDQVIKVLQDELSKANNRHEVERQFFTDEIARVRNQNRLDRVDSQETESELRKEIATMKDERIQLLDQIRGLKEQLDSLEIKVSSSLDEAERTTDKIAN